MKITLKLFGTFLAMLLVQISHATPITLDFNTSSVGTSYTENGMTITSTSAEPVRTNGVWYLDCCDAGPETFSLTTGGMFDLLNVFINHVDSSDPVVWTAYLAGSIVSTNTFNSGQGSVYNFIGFTGIDLVTMSVSGTWTDSSFDNLTYDDAEAVPEPTSLALLGLGLAGVGFSRKKKM